MAGTDLAGVDFTLREEFTDPPDDLRREGAVTVRFFVRLTDELEVGDHPTDDADVKIVSDYEDALSIARDPDAPAANPRRWKSAWPRQDSRSWEIPRKLLRCSLRSTYTGCCRSARHS
jgi:hypothetical protein